MVSEEKVIVKLEASTIVMRPDSIMEFRIAPTREFSIQDVKDIVDTVGRIGGGKQFCNLIVLPADFSAAAEVRQYAAEEAANVYTIADAFVTTSLPTKILINFYILFHKPLKPTRMFMTEENAIRWLKKFH